MLCAKRRPNCFSSYTNEWSHNKPHFIAVSSLASLAFIPRTTKSLKLMFVDFLYLFVCFMIIGVRFVSGAQERRGVKLNAFIHAPFYRGTWFSEPMSFLIDCVKIRFYGLIHKFAFYCCVNKCTADRIRWTPFVLFLFHVATKVLRY